MHIDIQTHRQQGDLISLLLFFKNKEGHSAAGRIRSIENSYDLIWS
jgi:hypothetical protein